MGSLWMHKIDFSGFVDSFNSRDGKTNQKNLKVKRQSQSGRYSIRNGVLIIYCAGCRALFQNKKQISTVCLLSSLFHLPNPMNQHLSAFPFCR